jgi:hypothetical protein
MKNLKKVSRQALKTIKGGYRPCSQGCSEGEICCGSVCRIGIPYTNPDFPDLEFLKCP